MSAGAWHEVGPGVFYRRYNPVDVSVGVILGPQGATVIDTRNNPAEAQELREDVSSEFGLPIAAVVNTHAHYDHCFGNQVFAAAGIPIYGHHLIPRHFQRFEAPRLHEVQRQPSVEPDKSWGQVQLTAPSVLIDHSQSLLLGGREVELLLLPPGHTETDLAVHIPDAGVWFLGDVVEESGPPMFGSGSFPLGWPLVLESLTRQIQESDRLVPGHGAVVTRDFVLAQGRKIAELAATLSDAYSRGLAPEQIHYPRALREYWPQEFLKPAAVDAYTQLAGQG